MPSCYLKMVESIIDHEYYGHICLIYKDDHVFGYVHSHKEADAICEKNERYQWDTIHKKNKAILHNLPQLTIHDIE